MVDKKQETLFVPDDASEGMHTLAAMLVLRHLTFSKATESRTAGRWSWRKTMAFLAIVSLVLWAALIAGVVWLFSFFATG